MSHEASSYRRSSGSRYRERDESYRRHREDSRRTEKYQHHEERRGRYSSSRRRSPSYDDYRDRYYRGRSRSRERYRYSDSRSRSRSREYRRRRRDSEDRRRSYSPAEPPSPPKFPRMGSADDKRSDTSEDDTIQNYQRHSVDFGEPSSDQGGEFSSEYLEDIEANKEKIHQAMEERLRQHLAAQGKVYPPPKPEPQQTTMFANDGSFMEMFKRMQEQQQKTDQSTSSGSGQPEVKKAPAPLFGKRRGGKILKTGIVEKKKPVEETVPAPGTTDAWTLYMMEVKKYKNFSCDIDSNSRPLVK
ncbi:peptidyl-prolyl cis-trans isomerase G [Phlebotomus papatasi]|uniref:peptidyl-prolyl cis-trans isomerase G n=1 Tax=Phlebotomus papatasi TaxID=29031 RepID=UPI00248449FC|nr:peptidyl-prolyl cis-trans isomerase G [Phlebotomus papatasi]